MGVWDRFGAARVLSRARSAELRGELGQAVTLFAQAGRLDEAARVMVLRGDGEADPGARLRHYVQAAATAPEGSPAGPLARRKRAGLLLSMSAGRAMTETLRQDLLEAARELEAMGELALAADAYGRAGDVEGEATALARAGDVERLDALLHAQQGRERESHARRDVQQRFGVLAATGRRREAVLLARTATDEALREQARTLASRRVTGDVVSVALGSAAPVRLLLGERVTIGRVASLSIASAAVSREHLALERTPEGAVVRDLGSRNGTTLRGMAVAGALPVGEGLELSLGHQVALGVRPSRVMPGALEIELGGARYVAPLGPASLGVGQWRLERTGAGDDAWIELVTGDAPQAFLGELSMAPRISILAGDAFATTRGGDPAVRLEGAA